MLLRYPVASGARLELRLRLALHLQQVVDLFVPPVLGLNSALILPKRAPLVKQELSTMSKGKRAKIGARRARLASIQRQAPARASSVLLASRR